MTTPASHCLHYNFRAESLSASGDDPEIQLPKEKYDKPANLLAQQKAKPKFTIQSAFALALAVVTIIAVIFGLSISLRPDNENNNNNNRAVVGANEREAALDPGTPTASPLVKIVRDRPQLGCQVDAIDVRNDGGSLLMRQYIDAEKGTVNVELEYDGIGWLGFGFSENGIMVPSTAVIGLPKTGVVEKYDLKFRALDGVVPLQGRQTLEDTFIAVENGRTILVFTKPLAEQDETSVKPGKNQFIWAIGSDEDLAIHQFKGTASADFALCEVETATSTPSPVAKVAQGTDTEAPTAAPQVTIAPTVREAPVVDGNQNLDCSFQGHFDVRGDGSLMLRQIINQKNKTVTVELEYSGIGWLGFGFSEEALMVPNTAVIGLPGQTVKKYSLQAQGIQGVAPLAERQTLIDESISEKNGSTILTFTKPLIDDGEVGVVAGDNRFIWAIGADRNLDIHLFRGSSLIPFNECVPVVDQVPTDAPVLTSSPSDSPVTEPASGPRYSPTSSPTLPQKIEWNNRTFSKQGNRKSCSIDVCPSDPWWGKTALGNACNCNGGYNSCYGGNLTEVTLETFDGAELLDTDTKGIWKLVSYGKNLNLGEGGDFASGVDCYDDPLRGGFRVDLRGTGLAFSKESQIWVDGYSPTMRMTADDGASVEVRKYALQARVPLWVPEGTQVVDVVCGGWPAECTSELYVSLA
jgi:hypothetical protein